LHDDSWLNITVQKSENAHQNVNQLKWEFMSVAASAQAVTVNTNW
jgi:hypothetical protein